MSIEKALRCIREHKRFLVTSHANLEGDALGSELRMYALLTKLGKQAAVMNEDDLPYGYEFLPYVKRIRKYGKHARVPQFDCFVFVDCSDPKRTGSVYTVNTAAKPVLNIDHHVSNAYFGDCNWVKPQASCACEMVYELYKKLRVPLDKRSATLLYAGIVTDTGSFRYSNTTAYTHQVAADLLSYGLDVSKIYRSVYANIPYSDLQLLAAIYPTMQQDAGGRLVWFSIRKDQLAGHPKLSIDLGESVLGFGRSLKGVEVVLLFKENLDRENEVRVNFRSTGKVDVNAIAAQFGGGGHKTASGATVKGTLDAVQGSVLAAVKRALG